MTTITAIHRLSVTEASRLFWRLRDLEEGLSGHARRRVTRMIARLTTAIVDAAFPDNIPWRR